MKHRVGRSSMDTFILLALVLLGILAVCDLFVGVSNDAVNFLNSAVGSKAAPFWVILAVAAQAFSSAPPFRRA